MAAAAIAHPTTPAQNAATAIRVSGPPFGPPRFIGFENNPRGGPAVC